MHRLVVVGGDVGGMGTVAQAMRLREDLEVVAFERTGWTSYSACGLPYWIGGVSDGPDALVARTPEQHRERGVEVRLRTEVVELDVEGRRVRWRALDGDGEGWQDYDDLVLATGASPLRPDVPGIDAPGVHGVATLDDAAGVREHLGAGGARRAVVVGAGYIGLEVAEALLERGLEVAVVSRSPTPLRWLDPDLGEVLAGALREAGVELVTGEEVVEVLLDADGRAAGVLTDAGRRLEADLVVLGLGVSPDVHLAREAGLEVGGSGGIVVDETMRTSAPGVWAAGDCVEVVHRVSGERTVVALATHATKQARVAGTNIGGGHAVFGGVLGTAITLFCGTEVATTGLNETQAQRAGFATVVTTVTSTTRAGYYPGAEEVLTTIVAEAGTGRLLGAQVVGGAGAGKRIDTLAACLWNEMTVEAVAGVDLSYAPPFSPTWDPVLITARKAAEAVAAQQAR